MAKHIIPFAVLLIVARQIDSTAIVAPPLSVNVTTGVTATFQCTTEGGALYWIINGTSSPTEWGEGINYDTRQMSTYQTSNLSIPVATEFRNNTLIKCAVNSIESGAASLLIQGLLRAPSLVSVVSNYTTIHLTWNAPYTLDITGVEPDISHYEVHIKNVDSEQYFRVNTSVTSYSFDQQSSSTACSVFEFQIAAVNLAGVGEKSAAVYGSYNIAPVLKASVNNDLQSVLLTCNASCSSDFILWFVNHTVLSDVRDVYYHKISKRHLNCFSSGSNAETYYTEGLQVVPMDSYSATLSCAAIFVCTREEINENCVPRVCYSAHEEDVRLFASTLTFHTNGPTTNLPMEREVTISETLQDQEDLELKHVIIGLGAIMVLLLIIIAATTTGLISAMIKRKKEATVIYEEPMTALPPSSTFKEMQQCPAYQITGQCTFRRSQT